MGIHSEFLRSQQKILVVHLENTVVQRENAAFWKHIEGLESASVRAPGSHTSTPASPANTPPDQTTGFHLTDPVVSLTQLGDFTACDVWWSLSHSNNDVGVDIVIPFILLSPHCLQIRFLFTNRHLKQQDVLFTLTSCLLRLESSLISLSI